MAKRKYSVIVSDLGNVLIPFDYNISYNKLEKIETGLGQRFLDKYRENEDLVSLLPELKKRYKLVLLSNTNIIHQKYGWNEYGFLKNFEKLILSHEVGAVKPEEKIYRAVEKYTKLPSGEHIFIDDIFEYVEAVKNLGWDAIQFKSYNQLINELKIRGLI